MKIKKRPAAVPLTALASPASNSHHASTPTDEGDAVSL